MGLFRDPITRWLMLANHLYGKQHAQGMVNGDVPNPDAFSHEGNANWVVVYKLGYPVKFLHRVLEIRFACENGQYPGSVASSVPLRPT